MAEPNCFRCGTTLFEDEPEREDPVAPGHELCGRCWYNRWDYTEAKKALEKRQRLKGKRHGD